ASISPRVNPEVGMGIQRLPCRGTWTERFQAKWNPDRVKKPPHSKSRSASALWSRARSLHRERLDVSTWGVRLSGGRYFRNTSFLIQPPVSFKLSNSSILAPLRRMITDCWITDSVL